SDLADDLVIIVANIQVVRAVHGNSKRTIESGAGANAIGIPSYSPCARQRRHHPGRSDLANRIVSGVGHGKIARIVDSNSIQVTETSRPARSTSKPAASSESRHRRYHRARRDLAHGEVKRIGNIDIATAVNRNSIWVIEPRGAAGAIDAPGDSG